MKLGFSQQIITPKHPCMLAGYDVKRVMRGIHDDLYVKVPMKNSIMKQRVVPLPKEKVNR